MQNIQQEYHSNIDKFSQDIIIAQLELLLNYADRFFHRQFITRKITNHKILNRLEDILTGYFKSDDFTKKGLPTVQYVAETLNVSPGYLSGLLKTLTGQNAKQYLHNKLIARALKNPKQKFRFELIGKFSPKWKLKKPQNLSLHIKEKVKNRKSCMYM